MTFKGTNVTDFVITEVMEQVIKPYEVASNNEGYWFVKGPGGYSYYSGYLYESGNIVDYAIAYQIAQHMKLAYTAGHQDRITQIKAVLNVQ